ncbi:MAG: hypothetical protein V4544_00190 [Pseudomonadota bacterium]
MINMHNQNTSDINVLETLSNFYPCVKDFIDVMDRENTCIKEHDTNSLIELLPLKKACSDRYERIMNDINQLLSLKALSRDDLISLSKANNEFMMKSKENYEYLNNAQEYSHRIMDIFFTALNKINKYCYTNKGQSKSAQWSQPVALSQTL